MTYLYSLSREDVEAHIGRPITTDEQDEITKCLEYALSDAVTDVIFAVFGAGSTGVGPTEDDDGDEIRADQVEKDTWVREFSDAEWVKVRKVEFHSDQVLVTGYNGGDFSIDQDSGVEVYVPQTQP